LPSLAEAAVTKTETTEIIEAFMVESWHCEEKKGKSYNKRGAKCEEELQHQGNPILIVFTKLHF
jgi:hypothetical protein